MLLNILLVMYLNLAIIQFPKVCRWV